MTVDELKQSHPETYNSIFNSGKTAGVSEEKDRTGSWLAHIGTDQQIVVEGIKSGNKISDTQREELLVAASAKRGLENLRVDSAQPISTPETKPEDLKREEGVDQQSKALSESIKDHLKNQ